jgi:hypothetical protein
MQFRPDHILCALNEPSAPVSSTTTATDSANNNNNTGESQVLISSNPDVELGAEIPDEDLSQLPGPR